MGYDVVDYMNAKTLGSHQNSTVVDPVDNGINNNRIDIPPMLNLQVYMRLLTKL
jgi:hypothetical protein